MMETRSENPSEQDHLIDISSSQLLGMSVISTIVYTVLAMLIYRFWHKNTIYQAFDHGYTIPTQLLIGVLAGSATAAIMALIVSRSPVSEVLHDFYIFDMISKMRLSNFDCIQVSMFAGAGEELLFRGALQPLLGNAFTSLIFVGMHGYFKFKSMGYIIFGVVMFGLSLTLGLLFEYAGLMAAMTTHAIYDIIMLKLVHTGRLGTQ